MSRLIKPSLCSTVVILNGSLTAAGEFEAAVLAVAALVFGFTVAGGTIVAGVTLQREA